jgi:acetyltransferase-like isoleucine patch superfamily enzyme
MSLFQALRKFASMPPSRQRQWVALKRERLITSTLHAARLRRCGRGTIVQRPLFWTPEFIELGERVLIWRDCRIEGLHEHGGSRYSPSIRFGNGVSLQQGCHITAADTMVIGDGTTLLRGVLITDIDHQYTTLDVDASAQPLRVQRTEIGSNCLIGAGACIQAGTRLGNQCVVGANAVVRGIFPDRTVIAGVPARIVKRYDASSNSWHKTNPEGQFL